MQPRYRPGETKAPETETEAPETKTEAPEAKTKAPEAKTKAPETNTKALVETAEAGPARPPVTRRRRWPADCSSRSALGAGRAPVD
jgi:hypothetical protein